MNRLLPVLAALVLSAPAWAHEDTQAHTHNEVVAGVIVLGVVFAALAVFARVRHRGDRP